MSPAAFLLSTILEQTILQNSSRCAILYKNNIFIQKVHTMNILAGAARDVVLNVPPGKKKKKKDFLLLDSKLSVFINSSENNSHS